MHAAGLPAPPMSPYLAPPQRRQPGWRRLLPAASPSRATARCRAGTLPPIDDLAEACAPEGAIYVDGVLFGGCAVR